MGSVEVRRGMTVIDQTGEPVGLVAGVVLAAEGKQIRDVVLSRVPPTGDYRLVAAELIAAVDEERISLTLAAADLKSLPRHDPE